MNKIHPAGKTRRIPLNAVISRILLCVYQRSHFLPENIVDAELYLTGGWKLITNSCCGIEWIGIILE
jgi:hypothetical protein